MRVIALIVCGILANTLPRWWFAMYGSTEGAFMKYQALSYVLLTLAGAFSTTNKRDRIWWDYCVVLAINNLVDELREHAEQIDGIEVLFAISATAWLIYKLIKCQTKTNN